MDAIRDVMGEEIPDGVVTKVIIDSQYDSEKALNTLLEYGCKDSSGECLCSYSLAHRVIFITRHRAHLLHFFGVVFNRIHRLVHNLLKLFIV